MCVPVEGQLLRLHLAGVASGRQFVFNVVDDDDARLAHELCLCVLHRRRLDGVDGLAYGLSGVPLVLRLDFLLLQLPTVHWHMTSSSSAPLPRGATSARP